MFSNCSTCSCAVDGPGVGVVDVVVVVAVVGVVGELACDCGGAAGGWLKGPGCMGMFQRPN